MNSFQELNYYSTLGVPFQDDRPPVIAFSGSTDTQVYYAYESQPFTTTTSFNITELLGVNANTVSFSVNVASLPGTTVTWPDILPGISYISSNGAGGIYTVNSITGAAVWDIVKSANINMPADYYGSWAFTSNLSVVTNIGIDSYTWNNSVTVIDTPEMANPGYSKYDTNFVSTITNAPTVVDTNLNSNYTLTIAPFTAGTIETISAGAGTFNNSTKTLTVTGNKAAINSVLSGNIVYTPGINYTTDFLLVYNLLNNQSNVTTTLAQTVSIGNTTPSMSTVANALSYTQNIPFTVVEYPQLTCGEANLNVYITPNVASSVRTITTAYGQQTFNNTTKQLKITGNLTTVNQALASLTVYPGIEYGQAFELRYQANVNIAGSPLNTVAQKITYAGPSFKMGQASPITYIQNTPRTIIGPSTIVFTDWPGEYSVTVASSDATNIISLTTSNRANVTTSSNTTTRALTLTGNALAINQSLGNITIAPTLGYRGNIGLTYTMAHLLTTDSARLSRAQNLAIGPISPSLTNGTVTRYYSQNSIQKVFANTVPTITSNTPTTFRIELEFGGNVGYVSSGTTTVMEPNATEWTWANLTYTTGNDTVANVNSRLNNLYFIPNKDTYDSVSVIVRQYENDYLQQEERFSFVGSYGEGPVYALAETITVTSSRSVPITFAQMKYLKCDVLAVAGGGAGGLKIWSPNVVLSTDAVDANNSIWRTGADTGTNAIPNSTVGDIPGGGPTSLDMGGGGGGAGGIAYLQDTTAIKNNWNPTPGYTNSMFVYVGQGGQFTDGAKAVTTNGTNSNVSINGNTVVDAVGGGSGADAFSVINWSHYDVYHPPGSPSLTYNNVDTLTYSFYGQAAGDGGSGGGGALGSFNDASTRYLRTGGNAVAGQGVAGSSPPAQTAGVGGTYSGGAGGEFQSWINGYGVYSGLPAVGTDLRSVTGSYPKFLFKGNISVLPRPDNEIGDTIKGDTPAIGDVWYVPAQDTLYYWNGTSWNYALSSGYVSSISGNLTFYASGSPTVSGSGGSGNSFHQYVSGWAPYTYQPQRAGFSGIVIIKFY